MSPRNSLTSKLPVVIRLIVRTIHVVKVKMLESTALTQMDEVLAIIEVSEFIQKFNINISFCSSLTITVIDFPVDCIRVKSSASDC